MSISTETGPGTAAASGRWRGVIAATLLLLVSVLLSPATAARLDERELRILLDFFAEQAELEGAAKPPSAAEIRERSTRSARTPPRKGDAIDSLAYRGLSLQRLGAMLEVIGLLMPYLNLVDSVEQSQRDLDAEERRALEEYRARTERLVRERYERLGGENFADAVALLRQYAPDVNRLVLSRYQPETDRQIKREPER